MASAIVPASASPRAIVQPPHKRGRAVPTASSAGAVQLVRGSKNGLSGNERRSQQQFCAWALHPTRVRKRASVVRSLRAELATDAQTGNVIDVNDADALEKHIAESGEKLVVVDISTRTCGPCKLIFPKFVKMSEEYPEEVLFLRIVGDFDSGTRALMRKWGVKGVPNFRFFRNGSLIHSHTGAKEDDLRAHFLTHYVPTQNGS